jgi:hypothetical protein
MSKICWISSSAISALESDREMTMRKWPVLLGLMLAASMPALADPRDDALAAMLRCTGISETQARLACYDSAVTQVRGTMAAPIVPVPPAPAPVTRTARRSGFNRFMNSVFGSGGPDRPPQTTIQQFGSEGIPCRGECASPSHQPGDTIDAISARLVEYQLTAANRLAVALDNGQDWIQISGGDPVGRLPHPALYYGAQIRRGDGGTYQMYLTGMPKVIYVRRMR